MKLETLIARLTHCANPLYPSQADRNRMVRAARTWKQERGQNWWARYGRWIRDHDTLREVGCDG